MKYLIVVDVQNDFIDGALGTAEAQAMLPKLIEKVRNFDGEIIFTLDTHGEDYLSTQEGQLLPIAHCIYGSEGWKVPSALYEIAVAKGAKFYRKNTFGSTRLAADLAANPDINSVEFMGLCTDICVISNALLIKAAMPEVLICIDSSCCAGVTPQKHQAALDVMQSCQIIIK